jgi:hyperosmotically inducible periplasmic protein
MKKPPLKFSAALLTFVSVLVLTLAACEKTAKPGDTVGQKVDQVIDKTNEKMGVVSDKVGEQMNKAGDAISNATTSLSADASATVAKTSDAISDTAITTSIKADLIKDPELSVMEMDVNTKLGTVVLNGLTPNEGARQRAEKIAGAVKGVNKVQNNLTVTKL